MVPPLAAASRMSHRSIRMMAGVTSMGALGWIAVAAVGGIGWLLGRGTITDAEDPEDPDAPDENGFIPADKYGYGYGYSWGDPYGDPDL